MDNPQQDPNEIVGEKRKRNQTSSRSRVASLNADDISKRKKIESLQLFANIFTVFCAMGYMMAEEGYSDYKDKTSWWLVEDTMALCFMGMMTSCVLYLELLDLVKLTHGDKIEAYLPLLPKMHRTIDSLSEQEAELWTRFQKSELTLLMAHLRIPDVIYIQKHKFFGEEVLIIALNYLALGENHTGGMRDRFGGDCSRYGAVFWWFINHLYRHFYHKITGDSLRMWVPEVPSFRLAIAKYMMTPRPNQPADSAVHLENPQRWRIFAWIDCVGLKCCRPGAGPTTDGSERQDQGELQRCFFNTYCKAHGLKGQVVVGPNGLALAAFIDSLRQNDVGMLNMSNLEDYLLSILPYDPINGTPSLYGDAIYIPSLNILRRIEEPETQEEKNLNKQNNAARTSVEHFFAIMFLLWHLLDMKKKLRLKARAVDVSKLFYVSLFLTNVYTCMRGNEINNHFDIDHPTLESYLPLNEVLDVFDE